MWKSGRYLKNNFFIYKCNEKDCIQKEAQNCPVQSLDIKQEQTNRDYSYFIFLIKFFFADQAAFADFY